MAAMDDPEIVIDAIVRAYRVPHTSGAIHVPSPEGATVEGGIRARMKLEDAARARAER